MMDEVEIVVELLPVILRRFTVFDDRNKPVILCLRQTFVLAEP